MQDNSRPHDINRHRKTQHARVEATKGKIIKAVIKCLDENGYSETTVNRVQTTANVSRGALTHHFPTKEEMMVETLEKLLVPVRSNPTQRNKGTTFKADLIYTWNNVLNTREGLALFEILVASRTDKTLAGKIAPSLRDYEKDINKSIVALYANADEHADEAVTLWAVARAFLRGLHTQQQFDPDPKKTLATIEKFADLIAPRVEAHAKGYK